MSMFDNACRVKEDSAEVFRSCVHWRSRRVELPAILAAFGLPQQFPAQKWCAERPRAGVHGVVMNKTFVMTADKRVMIFEGVGKKIPPLCEIKSLSTRKVT